MVANTRTLEITNFSSGLNLRDDEFKLGEGETPRAQNFEIVKKTGLQKIKGHEEIFAQLDPCIDVYFADNFTTLQGLEWYVVVAYPEILLVNPITGAYQTVYDQWFSTGDPFGFEAQGVYFLVDGKNGPVVIDGDAPSATAVSWPPSYTADNNADGNLDQSNLATAPNPAASDIGFPSLGVYHTGRVWLAGDSLAPTRIYASRIFDITDFDSNTPQDFDIAFFVDVPTPSPITALKVISDKDLVVYCDRRILLLKGENPPGLNYPAPTYEIRTLNFDDGCLGKFLVAERGDNDHYFVSGNGRIYQLSLTQSFEQVKPLGLTEKIFPFLEGYTNETFRRGRLINHKRKGELLYWLPSTNQRRYPNVELVLNYGDKPDQVVWSQNRDFGDDFILRSAFIDRETNNVILVNRNQFFKTDTGNSFINGEPIKTIYQVATLDFGTPNNFKEVTRINIYGRSSTGANLVLCHLWDISQSGATSFTIPPRNLSRFGQAVFDTDVFSPGAGEPFVSVPLDIVNRVGRILKLAILHESDSEDFQIDGMEISYRLLGKE